jgi:hypothetical protein
MYNTGYIFKKQDLGADDAARFVMRINLIVEIAGFFAVAVFSIVLRSTSIFLVYLFVWPAFRLMIAREKKNNTLCLNLVLLLCILSMAYTYLAYDIEMGRPYYIGGSDDLGYEEAAALAVEKSAYTVNSLIEKNVIPRYHNSPLFVLLISYIIRVTNVLGGFHTMVPRILNIFLFIFSVLLTLRIGRELKLISDKNEQWFIIGLGLFPNAVFISVFVFRDIMLTFLLVSFVYSVITISRRSPIRQFITLLWIGIILYCVFYLRTMFIATFLVGAVAYLFRNSDRIINTSIIVVLIIILMVGTSIPLIGEYINNYYGYLAETSTGGLSERVFSLGFSPLGLGLRTLYGLVTPFPSFFSFSIMEYISNIQSMLSIGTILQIFFFPFVVLGLRKNNFIKVMYLVTFLQYILLTFTFRHLVAVYPFQALLIGAGIEDASSSQKVINFAVISSILMGGCVLYLALKLL